MRFMASETKRLFHSSWSSYGRCWSVASATRIEERTRGVDAVRGVLEQLDYRGLRPPALDLAQPHTRVVSRSRSRYEDHSSIW